METHDFIPQLTRNEAAIRKLLENISDEQARWKPAPDKWSILEIVNHLYDEEREDFRTRLNLVLHHTGDAWPSIDPAGWVTEREYGRRSIVESLDRFSEERRRSIHWLRGLENVDWKLSYDHPKLGVVRAGDLMLAWLCHDFLHIRQLVGVLFAYETTTKAPFTAAYAGKW